MIISCTILIHHHKIFNSPTSAESVQFNFAPGKPPTAKPAATEQHQRLPAAKRFQPEQPGTKVLTAGWRCYSVYRQYFPLFCKINFLVFISY